MAVFRLFSLSSARREATYAHSESFPLSDSMASGFGAVAPDPAGGHARRHSDAARLHRKRTNMQRWVVAYSLIGSYCAMAWLFYVMGLAHERSMQWLLGTAVALPVVFFFVFLLRINKYFEEKRLKAPIVASAIATMLAMVYFDPALQILLAPFSFVALAYGMYRMATRTMLLFVVLELLGYATVIAMHYLERDSLSLLKLEGLHFIALAASLLGFVYLSAKVPLLNQVLNQASRKIRTIEADARVDAQLGCFNRRYIVAALEEQKQRADESDSPLCIAILDLDHFKRINDEMGHLAGDEVLRTFAQLAQQNVRDVDVFGRYGGEEFLLIFPGTALLPALNTCERVRAQVESHAWNLGPRCKVTVSIGVTQYLHGESVLELFSRADTATYLAKEGGRNQVVIEEPSEGPREVEQPFYQAAETDQEGIDEDLVLLEEAGIIESTRAPLSR